MKILYLGDGPLPGPANYLYGALHSLGYSVGHVPPDQKLGTSCFRLSPALLILSDYPYSHLKTEEALICRKVIKEGMGLLMVGGWGSFSGGGYRGSKIEDLLPVSIKKGKKGDDRLNYSPGLRIYPANGNQKIINKLPFELGPVICGLNQVTPKRTSKTILEALPLKFTAKKEVRISPKSYPLLTVGEAGKGRVAAFATDFAPHWAGGLVDWGHRRMTIRIPARKVSIEVGDSYICFIRQLVSWLVYR